MHTSMRAVEAHLSACVSPRFQLFNMPRSRKSPIAIQLEEEMRSITSESSSITALADEEGRELTPAERAKVRSNFQRFEEIEADLATPIGRRTDPNPLDRHRGAFSDGELRASPAAPGPAGRLHRDLFAQQRAEGSEMSIADFVRHVANGIFDPRLIRAQQGEDTGVGGGFAVPPTFGAAVWDLMLESSIVLPRARIFAAASNSLSMPIPDIADRTSNIAGVRGRWLPEHGEFQVDEAKPTQVSFRLNKLGSLLRISNEWISDVLPQNGNLFVDLLSATLRYDLDHALLRGTGVGQPLGITEAPSVIAITPESGQSADTVVFGNITNAWARLHPECQANAVWICSPSVLPQLLGMRFPGTGSGASVPVFLPGGGAAESPHSTLMGRPLLVSEHLPHAGDRGDLVLVDLSKYGIIARMPMVIDRSDARYFEFDQIGLRAKLRIDARALWADVHTPRGDTSYTLSWCVAIADR